MIPLCADCGVPVESGYTGWMDDSFVFSLIEADILSCLLVLQFAELYLSHWRAHSFHYIVTHWGMHLPSLCISPLLCLPLVWFPLAMIILGLAIPQHCTPHSLIPVTAIIFYSFVSFSLNPLPFHLVGLPAHHVFLPSSLILLRSSYSFLVFPSSFPLLLCRAPPSLHLSFVHGQQLCLTMGVVSKGSAATEGMMMALHVCVK